MSAAKIRSLVANEMHEIEEQMTGISERLARMRQLLALTEQMDLPTPVDATNQPSLPLPGKAAGEDGNDAGATRTCEDR